jgi:SAM-dependent methyltransferase
MQQNLKIFDKIDRTISTNDSMYQGNEDHYFFVGYSALKCIFFALETSGKDPSQIKTILDLPSGYGRVIRWIQAGFPDAEITACDLDTEAVNFCNKQFGVDKIFSHEDPDKIQTAKKFDLIWCGSLFTHLNSEFWEKFLSFFEKFLNPDGILLFTTHGSYVAFRGQNGFDYGLKPEQFENLIKNFSSSGFGYENYPNTSGYGITLSKPSFVMRLLESHQDFRIILYLEKGWDHHQDVVACFKDTRFKEISSDYCNEFTQLFGR